jgi:hypothetical protein
LISIFFLSRLRRRFFLVGRARFKLSCCFPALPPPLQSLIVVVVVHSSTEARRFPRDDHRLPRFSSLSSLVSSLLSPSSSVLSLSASRETYLPALNGSPASTRLPERPRLFPSFLVTSEMLSPALSSSPLTLLRREVQVEGGTRCRTFFEDEQTGRVLFVAERELERKGEVGETSLYQDDDSFVRRSCTPPHSISRHRRC